MSCNKTEILFNEAIGEECVKIEHKSGLTVYISKKPFSTAYAVIGTRYGSFDNVFKLKGEEKFTEVPEGIAHFLEHKMFESEDGHDAFEDFADAGADANAYTSTDRTAYLFSCADGFCRSLDTLLKMVTTPVFTEENVKKEQGIIGQEIKMCLDRPSNALYYGLMQALYSENAVRTPIAGTVESIANITPELLYKCYGVFYRPSNMALCIAGDVDVDKIVEAVDRAFPEEKTEEEIVRECVNEAPGCFKKRVSLKMEVARPLFRIGIKDACGDRGDSATAAVLTEAVFGQSSDFYSSLYEDGRVSSYSAYSEYSRPACYTVIGGDSDDPEGVFEYFCGYTERLARDGISRESFERAKRVLYAGTMRLFDSSESIAEGMLDGFLVSESFTDQAESYAKVTYEEVTALAERLFKEDRYALCTVYPK